MKSGAAAAKIEKWRICHIMKSMKKHLSRATSLFLTVVMLLSMMTTGVFAAENGTPENASVGTLVENAILYQINENGKLEYNGVHQLACPRPLL